MKLDDLKTCRLPKSPIQNHKQLFHLTIKEMLSSIEQDQITFNQLMLVLAKYNVKFYSPNQFKKICKLFNNSYQSIPKYIPFSYMQLHHTYREAHQNYYLINISSKKIELFVNDGRQHSKHDVGQCLRDFIIIMKKRYGKEINWFKVIGGMTVSVTIQVQIFKDNLKEILKNSKHGKCIDGLTEVFLQPPEKHIYWQNFMSTIKKHIKILQEQLKEKQQAKTIQNNASFDKSYLLHQKCKTQIRCQPKSFQRSTQKIAQKRSISSVIKTKTESSFYVPPQNNPKRKENHIDFRVRSNTQTKQRLNDFIVMKKCSLHSKMSSSNLFFEHQSDKFRKTTQSSAFKSQEVALESNYDNKRQTFFWNYLRKKRKRQA